MSCEVESTGVIAAVVVAAPVLAAIATGYAMLESGKFLIKTGSHIQQEMARVKLEQAHKNEQREEAIRRNHEEMMMVFDQLRKEVQSSGMKNSIPINVDQDIFSDLFRLVIEAEQTDLSDAEILKADPQTAEKLQMNRELIQVVDNLTVALQLVKSLESEYGLLDSANTWFHSCFNGIDQKIKLLLDPTTNHITMKQGIASLNRTIDQYYTMLPTIEAECEEFKALYEFYVSVSRDLDEKVELPEQFKSVKQLKTRIQELKSRVERAKRCAEIYQKLGKNAYICYAWDQELKALGYLVHEEKSVEKMTQCKPEHGKIEGKKLPFYQWSENELMQLYSIADASELQVIVHEDGSVSMETIASGEQDTAAMQTQSRHCNRIRNI